MSDKVNAGQMPAQLGQFVVLTVVLADEAGEMLFPVSRILGIMSPKPEQREQGVGGVVILSAPNGTTHRVSVKETPVECRRAMTDQMVEEFGRMLPRLTVQTMKMVLAIGLVQEQIGENPDFILETVKETGLLNDEQFAELERQARGEGNRRRSSLF